MATDMTLRSLDDAGFGLWHLDRTTGTASWTPLMASLHGLDGTSGDQSSLFTLVEADDRRGLDEAVAHAPHLSTANTVEYRVVDRAGAIRWISATVTAADADTGGTVVSMIASDITQRKQHDLAAEERRARIEGLHWVAKAVIAGTSLQDTAASLVEAASDVLGASSGLLVHIVPDDNGGSLQIATTGVPSDSQRAPGTFVWPAGREDDQAIIVDDVTEDAASVDLLRRLGLPDSIAERCRSMILIPLGPGARLGAMCFTREDAGYFTERDGDLARSIGSTAAAGIRNAQRNEEQRLAARTLQDHLLPHAAVEIQGVDICTQYHPGRDGLDVGGDWFDVIDLGGRIGLAVGDVCGHGLAAAAHMGQLRYSFRALVQAATPAEDALQVLNEIALELSTTATVAYVEIDVATGACAAWRCGHLPPVVSAGDDGAVRRVGGLGEGGPMLGFLDRIEVTPIRTNIDRGDVLLLYTDGLVERRGEVIDEGLERLAAALTDSLPVEGLDDRCGALIEALSVVAPDADDVALVAVRRV